MLLWMYTDRLAAGDDGWWRASTRRTADMLSDGFWWVDDTGPDRSVWLLIDTTAVLVHGLARSHGAHPAEVTGADLVTWATPRIAGMLQLAEDLFLRPPVDPDGMWAWHRAFGQEWRATVQQVAYLLVAAGHELLPAADPVSVLWRDLTEGDDPGRRYPAVAGPAIVHGLTEMVRHFGYPARH
ncbi:hypothetical protein [Actinoplanes couchii]|uniref:Uncharacterized protein n=1 Tax=Actinoplanes couchii TaxID=403638 RepID=A0ABQ3XHH4_9ACTN|nr:hypothetical protein [Actinoplanes couchii]MDR6317549.1 hypothetical protein [Actinoplanes couchii]GID57931.1 hypothetical protein Aco03nite_063350 [Actinoplanes couchii]